MKIFISASEEEKTLAKIFSNSIHNSFKGKIDYFLSSEKIVGGDNWKQKIKDALVDSEIIISLATNLFIQSPWFYIEWSAFWLKQENNFQNKIFVFKFNGKTEIPEIVRDSQIILYR